MKIATMISKEDRMKNVNKWTTLIIGLVAIGCLGLGIMAAERMYNRGYQNGCLITSGEWYTQTVDIERRLMNGQNVSISATMGGMWIVSPVKGKKQTIAARLIK